MDLLKLNIVSYESSKNIDFLSLNDVKIIIKYDNYTIDIPIIKNKNKIIYNNEFIFRYKNDTPLTITVFDTDNIFGDVELHKEVIFKLYNRRYINSALKYYYEIIYNNEDIILLNNYFNKFLINTKSSKIEKIKNIINK